MGCGFSWAVATERPGRLHLRACARQVVEEFKASRGSAERIVSKTATAFDATPEAERAPLGARNHMISPHTDLLRIALRRRITRLVKSNRPSPPLSCLRRVRRGPHQPRGGVRCAIEQCAGAPPTATTRPGLAVLMKDLTAQVGISEFSNCKTWYENEQVGGRLMRC